MKLIKSAQQAKVRFKDIFQKIKGIIFFNEPPDLEQQNYQTLSGTKTSKKFVKKSKMQKCKQISGRIIYKKVVLSDNVQ